MAEVPPYPGTENLAPKRPHPGNIAFRRGIAALAVAVGGYLLGFLVPLLLGLARSRTTGARLVFMPVGGIIALMLSVVAIYTGKKVKAFLDAMPPLRRQYLSRFMDPDLERRRASTGITLGIIAIIANPLIGFALYVLFS
ncbi:MAG: hypothetical protein V1748_10245 [Actinomycetota bacterium]